MLANRATDAPLAQRASLYMIACDEGREDACFSLAKLQRDGASSPTAREFVGAVSIEAGLKLARAHCDIGETRGCDSLAAVFTVQASPAALATSVAYLEKACDRGFIQTCNGLGQALLRGPDEIRDVARGAGLLRRACDLGYPFACPDPMHKMGVYPPLGAVIRDRRAGLEWAPPSYREVDALTARDVCSRIRDFGPAPFRLPRRKDLASLVEREGTLRLFARASLPRSGNLLSGEAPWVMHIADGAIASEEGAKGIAFCVRDAGKAPGKKGPVLALRMNGKNLDYTVRDARGKALSSGTFDKLEEVPSVPIVWTPVETGGAVDVDVAPEVPWNVVVRVLDQSRKQGLVLGRISIDAGR